VSAAGEVSGTIPSWEAGPHVIAAEMAVCGAVIGSRAAAEEAAGSVTEDDFYRPAHQMVFAAALALADDGKPVDAAAVLAELTRRGQVTKMGAGPYLATLAQHAVPVQSVPWHAARVAADATRRRTGAAAMRIAQLAANPAFDPATDGDTARAVLDDALGVASETSLITSAQMYDETIEELENPEEIAGMIAPPYRDLRDVIPVLRPGQLITVGARPGTGKSILASDLARHAGLHGRLPVIMFSLEMSRSEITNRMLSAETGIPMDRIMNRNPEGPDWDKIAGKRDLFADGALLLDVTEQVTVAHVRARLRGMARTSPAKLAIIDYLQLMDAPSAETRAREIAIMTKGLKRTAREFGIPIVLLAQLNRGSEQRHDKRPIVSDLKESGSVEQDSDIVVLLHREDMYDPESSRAGEIDLIVGKNRNGPLATRTLACQPHYSRLAGMASGGAWTPSATADGAA
jgi:replicative DNA helicase